VFYGCQSQATLLSDKRVFRAQQWYLRFRVVELHTTETAKFIPLARPVLSGHFQ